MFPRDLLPITSYNRKKLGTFFFLCFFDFFIDFQAEEYQWTGRNIYARVNREKRRGNELQIAGLFAGERIMFDCLGNLTPLPQLSSVLSAK